MTERERLARLRHPAERRLHEVAWSLRRWALTRCRPAIPEAAWRFAAGPHGKPALAAPFDGLPLHHNLSHGGAYAAVLLAAASCGVDVEAPPAGLEAATVVFGPAELAAVAAHPRPAECFLQHWVAKEAVLKLLGTGFGDAPDRLQLTLSADTRTAALRDGSTPDLPTGTAVRLWPLPEGHWLAAALPGPVDGLEPGWAPWSAAQAELR